MRISDWSSDVCSSVLQLVEMEFGVAKKRVKRRTIDIPVRENQPAIQMHPRLLQPKLLLRALVPVHLLLLDRRPDEAAVRTKRPAMINAAMRLRIARLAKTHLHPAMRTHVQRYMNLALTRSEEHTYELQPLMRIQYAVFCLQQKT